MKYPFEKKSDWVFELPRRGPMQVPLRLYTTEGMLKQLEEDQSIDQLMNVASLPGLYRYALGMPDMHQGFGFPIGAVAAFDTDSGLISPGGVGFDINCGVRLLRTGIPRKALEDRLDELGKVLFSLIPSGVGSTGHRSFTKAEMKKILNEGAAWTIREGYGTEADRAAMESHGRLDKAEADLVSEKAVERGRDELGTLGAGNHFLEIDYIETVYDQDCAKAFGLAENEIVVWIHTGSRGLGHQVATDYINLFKNKMDQYRIPLYNHELAALPYWTDESRRYFAAMAAAANYAWTNRQIITHQVRTAFEKVCPDLLAGRSVSLVYDVTHNIAKEEIHEGKRLLVHRKGGTRAFPPGHPELEGIYARYGQPVLLPGDMRRGSYILVGTETSMEETFGSTAHGAGRRLSRNEAVRRYEFEDVWHEMEKHRIKLFAADKKVAREEAPGAYKDVEEVLGPIVHAGIARPVARSRPLVVIKG
ncbi:RtcB family protein [Gracilinema caldarium]|uniref:RtcB family protein n=1 Tax=Gracilinema caldarium TaxID=215591 RepID=UPI0026F1B8B0|nr:RtcB family protein [Gracilinema caldarium]